MGLPSVGPLELIIVLAIALLVVGPKKLPEMGSAFGRTIREFRQSTSGLSDITDLGKTESQSAAVPQDSAPSSVEATPEPPPFEPPAADVAPVTQVATPATSAIPPTEAKAGPADDSA
jgi:sec-independent protein translocase protein TatA